MLSENYEVENLEFKSTGDCAKEIVNDSTCFQPLPQPTGTYPYRLDLKSVVGEKNYDAIIKTQKMVFHTVGDTGDEIDSHYQKLVAQNMATQFEENKTNNPAFFYILGDVVYNFGEADKYGKQFYEPYQFYKAPIFAIPGNHDGDINPNTRNKMASLYAFKKYFCDDAQKIPTNTGNNIHRKTMIQPNVYWTLETPVANIIGLYTNVPQFGIVKRDQEEWLIHELRAAGKHQPQKALIITLHHAPFSMDTGHGPSYAMQNLLEKAYKISNVLPDLVLSGHVHNYQRFTKKIRDREIPYVVAGGGGYLGLHGITDAYGGKIKTPTKDIPFPETVFESYFQNGHGFLRVSIDAEALTLGGEYFALPIENDKQKTKSILFDKFSLDLKTHRIRNAK